MKELSIFIDESGDFGEYSYHSPYYIITMVFHNQSSSIESEMEHLEKELSYLSLSNHCIHTGPIIRKEENYSLMDVRERRRIFNKMVAFTRQVDIKYKCFYIEKSISKMSWRQPVSFQSKYLISFVNIIMIFLTSMM